MLQQRDSLPSDLDVIQAYWNTHRLKDALTEVAHAGELAQLDQTLLIKYAALKLVINQTDEKNERAFWDSDSDSFKVTVPLTIGIDAQHHFRILATTSLVLQDELNAQWPWCTHKLLPLNLQRYHQWSTQTSAAEKLQLVGVAIKGLRRQQLKQLQQFYHLGVATAAARGKANCE